MIVGMNEIKNYLAEHEERFLGELKELIAIPSISAKSEHKEDMYRCAEWWKSHLSELGVEQLKVYETAGNPIVYGEYLVDKNSPTLLVYSHYDVMPAEPLELWKTPPFELSFRDGYMFARGADDDKGQAMIQVKGFEIAKKLGYIRCNVKFLFEGEEEIGSKNLYDFCEQHKEMLRADYIIVSDTSMVSKDTPSLTTGLRGLAYWEVEVTGPNRDLHSGHFGGAVANPINELCKLIAKMQDENGRITIPGFYDDVEELSQEEKAMLDKVPFDEEKYKASIGVKALWGEKGYGTLERNASRPSFDVCGIWGGYTGEGSKTVLPSKAFAKLSCRLVPNQDHHKISQLFADYFRQIAPGYIQVEVRPSHGGQAYVCPIDLPAYRAAEQALEMAFEVRPLAVRRGGSIPIIAAFEEILGIKSILMGFGLESDAIHSPNENMPLDQWRKGVTAVAEFYRIFPG